VEGLRVLKLGDVIEVKHGFAFKSEHFTDQGEYILLTPGNFQERGGLQLKGEKEKFYKGDFPAEYLLRRGDLLLAMTDLTQNAPILGSPAFVPEDDRYLHNQRLGKVINLKPAQIDLGFLFYLFNTSSVRGQIKGSASGATVRHTSPSRICDVTVRIPALKVQRRIARILGNYDELIENNRRRMRTLEEMTQALYREWFVEFRFPGYEEVRRVTSSLGDIPKGWEVRPLSAVAEVNRAQIGTRNAPDEINYIDIASVSPGQIDTVTTYAFSEAPGRARRIVQHGDVLWSCVRPNRRSHALVMFPEQNTIASTGFAVLSAKTVPYTFLYAATSTDEFVGYLTNNASGAAYPAVTASAFEKAELVVPSPDLLRRFAEVTVPMAEEAQFLRAQVENLRRTRDLLIPKLLSTGTLTERKNNGSGE
jgi:type I restriction enzyme, S subunit